MEWGEGGAYFREGFYIILLYYFALLSVRRYQVNRRRGR